MRTSCAAPADFLHNHPQFADLIRIVAAAPAHVQSRKDFYDWLASTVRVLTD